MHTWSDIEQHVASCTCCPLSRTRHLPVMGRGSHSADIMLIAEAPGGQEDQEGLPFVGRSGKILDELLESCSLTREEIYITNILKCRPPHNRDPLPAEQDCCMDYLRAQVKLIQPKIIACLGRIAAMRLITPDFKITRDHGAFHQRGNFLITAVYHPSALLRDPRKNEDMYRDMKAIRQKLDELEG